ncbi:MAG TPA: hypothetical protein PKH33_18550 [bacterium]|nr:hypothetical protein [bacterium]
MKTLTLSGTTYNRRRLIQTMLEMNYGQIEGLRVVAGEPVFDPPPKIICEILFGKENTPNPHFSNSDFVLKRQVLDLFDALDRVGDGVIHSLAVQNGLPVRMRLEKQRGA